ncbi:hypothetical protein CNR22_21105 [Sphingobacteriaceae bacterium]|nr:hypothetical protein CNR22_21105 [Sphingobacteriaceae bacterium]
MLFKILYIWQTHLPMKVTFTTALLAFCIIFSISCKKEVKRMDWKTEIENFSEPSASYKASDLFIQEGDSVYFENCSKIYDKISWDFGDGTSSNELSPKHIFKAKGIYAVSITTTYRKVERTFTQQVYCGMQAAADVTFNFSDWNIPADYLNKNYTIVIDCSLYRNSDTLKKVSTFTQFHYLLNKNDPFKVTFPLIDERTDYQVKAVLRGIYPILTGNGTDTYQTEDLGSILTSSIRIFGPSKINKSFKVKFATLNYASLVTIN